LDSQNYSHAPYIGILSGTDCLETFIKPPAEAERPRTEGGGQRNFTEKRNAKSGKVSTKAILPPLGGLVLNPALNSE
jgi:hypothetical protein